MTSVQVFSDVTIFYMTDNHKGIPIARWIEGRDGSIHGRVKSSSTLVKSTFKLPYEGKYVIRYENNNKIAFFKDMNGDVFNLEIKDNQIWLIIESNYSFSNGTKAFLLPGNYNPDSSWIIHYPDENTYEIHCFLNINNHDHRISAIKSITDDTNLFIVSPGTYQVEVKNESSMTLLKDRIFDETAFMKVDHKKLFEIVLHEESGKAYAELKKLFSIP